MGRLLWRLSEEREERRATTDRMRREAPFLRVLHHQWAVVCLAPFWIGAGWTGWRAWDGTYPTESILLPGASAGRCPSRSSSVTGSSRGETESGMRDQVDRQALMDLCQEMR